VAKVTFFPANVSVDVRPASTILETAPASNKEGLTLLYRLFLSEASRMIGEPADRSCITGRHICKVVYSGNTTMLHLATNIDPSPLGRYPYTPILRGGDCLPLFLNTANRRITCGFRKGAAALRTSGFHFTRPGGKDGPK